MRLNYFEIMKTQDNLFEKAAQVRVPDDPARPLSIQTCLEESEEIVKKAIVDNQPYAICAMVSGGDDSITALYVARMLGIKIDFIIHGVTGTELRGCREYVRDVAERTGIKLLEADAGTAFEDYVKRKGFFGVGRDAHKFSYHILKDNPFGRTITKNLSKGMRGRKILLLNGVRIDESENRLDNFGDNPTRPQASRPNNIWVNIIHWFSDQNKTDFLGAENIQRSPVAMALGRSGECNCGTAQNAQSRQEACNYDPEWAERLNTLRKYAVEKFGWDIHQNPDKKRLAEIKAEAQKIEDYMPMCVGCKARQGRIFE